MKNKRLAAVFQIPFLLATTFLAVEFHGQPVLAEQQPPAQSNLDKDQLVAWCIVPFDPLKRGPRQRAEMLDRLGIKRVAYDWRAEHVPTFEEEILQYKRHGLEYFAFWGWHADMPPLMKKHGIHPQIWTMMASPILETQRQRIEAAAKQLLPMVQQVGDLGCKLGLYNHGGWSGEPENLVAVCRWLRKNADADHVGIVYNLHHGHGHIADFAESLELMKPYLLCLNLNGMNDNETPKILPLGQGQHEQHMLATIIKSGYRGPIGILDHRDDTDTEKALRANLEGMRKLLRQLGENQALKSYETD